MDYIFCEIPLNIILTDKAKPSNSISQLKLHHLKWIEVVSMVQCDTFPIYSTVVTLLTEVQVTTLLGHLFDDKIELNGLT